MCLRAVCYFGMLLMDFFQNSLQILNLLRFFYIPNSTEKVFPEKSWERCEKEKRGKFLWKFKRNISFCFDSAILLSVKQIIIQKLGVKRKNEKPPERRK